MLCDDFDCTLHRPPSPSRPRTPLQRPSMASARLSRRFHAIQAQTRHPVTRTYALQPPRPSRCSNVPRKQGSRCAAMGLLAQATRPSAHPLRHLPHPHKARACSLQRPASSLSIKHFDPLPNQDYNAETRGMIYMRELGDEHL